MLFRLTKFRHNSIKRTGFIKLRNFSGWTDEFRSDDEHNKESEKESKKSKNEIVSQSEIVSADAPKYCFSLTTWFSSPDLGMTDFEVLMRSSAFTIKSNSGNDPQYHVVTASHNVAPWLFPNYYPQPFLKYVNENHVHYTLEIRTPRGEFTCSQDLRPLSYHHKEKDLAILHLLDEVGTLSMFKNLGFQLLEIENYSPKDNEPIVCHGHHVPPSLEDDGGKDVRLSLPRATEGYLLGRTNTQIFIKTPSPLTEGMCGGPVISLKRGCVCGMVEGIVPETYSGPQADVIAGVTCMIDANTILKFAKDVEEKNTSRYNHFDTGDTAVQHVASDLLTKDEKELQEYGDPLRVLAKQL